MVVAPRCENQVGVHFLALVYELGIDDVDGVAEAAERVGERPVDLAESDPCVDLQGVFGDVLHHSCTSIVAPES